MQFTFYGYADISTECMAACKVEGGPTYQIRLSGEASNVQYRFSRKHIDFGKQVCRHVYMQENHSGLQYSYLLCILSILAVQPSTD